MTRPAGPADATPYARALRQTRFSMLALGIFASGCVTASSGAVDPLTAPPPVTFDEYEVFAGSAKSPAFLPGFFRGGTTAEIAVVHLDEEDNCRVRMVGFEGGAWETVLDAALGREVLFVDVATVGGRDRLITYESGRLSWFDPDAAKARALLEVATSYNPAPSGRRYAGAEPLGPSHGAEIPHVDITRDLNGDGRDDLVVPDLDGFWISTQSTDGSFTDPVKLGPPEPFLDETGMDEERSYREVGITAVTIPWYLSRVHQMDYDRDGRSDLVFWNQDHFAVHRQDERGRFDPVGETFTTDVPFDSDGAYSLVFGTGDVGTFSLLFGTREPTKRTVLQSFRDLNGDGVADLVTQSLEGRSPLRQRSRHEVRYGKPTPGGTAFARERDAAIQPRGRAGGMQFSGYSSQRLQDFDGDGRLDIMFRDVNVGIGGMMRAVVGNSVPLNLEFYRSDEGLYPAKPTTRRKIRRFAPLAGLGKVFFPPVLVGDVNGDGRSDLLVGRSPKKLHVYVGVPGPELFARQPQKVAVALPDDERNTWLMDLDRDGRQDLLVHRAPTGRAPTAPHRLTVLLAR